MEEKPYYKYFQEEKDDKISQKIFICNNYFNLIENIL